MTDTIKIEEAKFAASLLEASMRQTEATTSLVFDNYESTILEWQQRYHDLFHAVVANTEHVTSRKLEQVLDRHSYYAGLAEEAVEKAHQ